MKNEKTNGQSCLIPQHRDLCKNSLVYVYFYPKSSVVPLEPPEICVLLSN